MQLIEQVVPVITASSAAIAAAQAPTNGTALTLVGGSPFTITPTPDLTANLSRRVQLTGVGDVSAVTFAFVGADRNGNRITENVVGPGAAATVLTTKVYAQVTSITPQQTSANTLTVGWGTEAVSLWVAGGLVLTPNYVAAPAWKLRVFSPGNDNYDVEGTSQDMVGKGTISSGEFPDDLVILNTPTPLVNTNYTSDNTSPWAFVRLKVHSSASPVTMRIVFSRT